MVNRSFPAYDDKASRLELCIVRCLYMIPIAIIGGISAWLLGIGLAILGLINWLSILILGKRVKMYFDVFEMLVTWGVQVNYYFSFATDVRPPLTPFSS